MNRDAATQAGHMKDYKPLQIYAFLQYWKLLKRIKQIV